MAKNHRWVIGIDVRQNNQRILHFCEKQRPRVFPDKKVGKGQFRHLRRVLVQISLHNGSGFLVNRSQFRHVARSNYWFLFFRKHIIGALIPPVNLQAGMHGCLMARPPFFNRTSKHIPRSLLGGVFSPVFWPERSLKYQQIRPLSLLPSLTTLRPVFILQICY